MSRVLLVSLTFAAGLSMPGLLAQSPQLPYWATPGRGVIAGQVVDADSGRGVPAAVVQVGPRLSFTGASGLSEESLSAYSFGMRYVVADAQGRFVVRNVGPGSYALVLRASGYVLSAYGHQRPGGSTREIKMAADQRVTDIVIKAWKNAAIGGTVFDEAGEPAVGVSVRALRQSFSGGRRVFVSTFASTRTDDRGEYRLYGLEPADYAIVVPSTTVSVPTGTIVLYSDAAAAGNTAASSSIQRDATGLGASLSSPGIPIDDAYAMLAGPRARGLTLPGASNAASVYQTVFHPGAVESSQATVISLRSGEERSDINVQLKVARAFRVSGRVVSPDATDLRLQVSLIPDTAGALADPTGYETATTLSADDGRFRFLGVPEGQYVISVRRIQRSPTPATSTSLQVGAQTTTVTSVSGMPNTDTSNPILWARLPVAVDADVNDVSVSLSHGARVSGRIEFQGAGVAPVLGPTAGLVTLVSADGRSVADLPGARPTAGRQFTTSQYPPGRYFLSATPVGAGWSLKAAIVNGQDALKAPFVIGAEDLAGASLVFTDRPAELSGTVRDRSGASAPDTLVALFPADYRSWIASGMSARALRTAATDRDGTYRLGEVIPGEYIAIAYPASASKTLQDPAFIGEMAATGSAVTIGESDKKTAMLTVTAVR